MKFTPYFEGGESDAGFKSMPEGVDQFGTMVDHAAKVPNSVCSSSQASSEQADDSSLKTTTPYASTAN